MSEEPQREQAPSENVDISEGVLSYMLGLVDTSTLVRLVLKTFKPGTEIFKDFIDNCTKDTKFRKLFVFDLPPTVTEEMIRSSFSIYGDIEDVRLVTDAVTNKPKGYGFIVFVSALGALRALSAEVSIEGSVIHLKYAIANTNPPRPTDGGSGSDSNTRETLKLHVKGFPITWTNEDMATFFKKIGPIQEAFICYEKGTQISRGFGFVTFVSKEDYDRCLESGTIPGDGFEIHCSPISLSKSDDRFRRSRNDRRYDDHRYDNRRYDDRRYDDRRYEDRRYEDRRYEDRRYEDRRSHYNDRQSTHRDRSRERHEESRDDYRSGYNYQRYNQYGYPPQQEYMGNNYSPYHPNYDAYPPSSYPTQSNYSYSQNTQPQESSQSQATYDPSYYPPSSYCIVCWKRRL